MLREYRKRCNLSQEQLEKITNIDRKTIFRILLDTFAKMAIALKLSDKEIAYEVKKCIKKENN